METPHPAAPLPVGARGADFFTASLSLRALRERVVCRTADRVRGRSIKGILLSQRRNKSCLLWAGLILAASCGHVPPGEQEASSLKATRFPQRIISLSPSVSEILDGVGAFDRVVGVSDYCTYPPAVKQLPRVGGWQTTSLEQVNALQPDLVIMTEPQAAFVKDQLETLGLQTLVVPSQSLDNVFTAMAEIGQAVGNKGQAEALFQHTQSALDAIRSRVHGLGRPRVLCVVDRVPGTLRDLYAATKGSFLAQLVEVTGGESIAPPAGAGYAQMSKEAVLSLNPEVIIDMVQGPQGKFAEDPIGVWQEFSEVQAVRAGRIFPIRQTSAIHPSQFVADTAKGFAKMIHPEIFDHETEY